jgi:hypothetical protein
MNYKIITFIFSFLMTGIIYGQRDSIHNIRIDTLRVQTIDNGTTKTWYESPALPAIAALVITLVGILVNIYIAKKNWKNTLDLSNKQFKDNADLASKQFDSKLYADNRQEWINKVRDCMSELITHCNLLNIAFQENDNQHKQSIHEKVTLHRNQLRLFLTPEITVHKKVLEDLSELMNLLDRHLLNSQRPVEPFDNVGIMRLSDKVIESGRDMLYVEWAKIQEAQKKYF